MAKTRARNLSSKDIEQICSIIDGWGGPLTWVLLLEDVERRTGQRYTRQALDRHASIAAAFGLKKRTKAGEGASGRLKSADVALEAALQRIDRLEEQVKRMKAQNTCLLEQFVRWAYNAHTRGIGEDVLNRPLPDRNRSGTKPPVRVVGQ